MLNFSFLNRIYFTISHEKLLYQQFLWAANRFPSFNPPLIFIHIHETLKCIFGYMVYTFHTVKKFNFLWTIEHLLYFWDYISYFFVRSYFKITSFFFGWFIVYSFISKNEGFSLSWCWCWCFCYFWLGNLALIYWIACN